MTGEAITTLEGALRESETRFRLLVSAVRDYAIFMIDTAGRVTSWNLGAERIKGYQAREIIGQHFSRFYAPKDIAEGKPDRTLRAAAAEGRFEDEGWRVRKDGSLFWASVVLTALHDESGKLVGYGKVTRDLTDRKRSDDALRISEERYRLVAQATHDTIWDWDLETDTVYWNENVQTLFGYARNEVGRNALWWHETIHPEDRARVVAAIHSVIAGTESHWSDEYRYARRDGTYSYVIGRGYVMRDEHRTAFRMVGCMTDISRHKEAEEALCEADRHKDDFLAILGHELRNPLNVIGTAVQLLRMNGPADPALQELRDIITHEVSQLARLLDDLLDNTRIARGVVRLEKEPCDLVEVMREVVEDRRSILRTSGLELTAQYPPQPLWVIGDRTRLAQTLGNLLDNANKFTGSGGQVRVRLCEEAETQAAVLSVADTGMGIDTEILQKIFQPFTQADRTVASSRGGLGLGLALVKGLVDLHGGEVWVCSDGPGRGSEFTIRLPLTSTPKPQAITMPGESVNSTTEPRRILLIEDNLAAAQTLRMFLTAKGHAVERADSGPAGIEAARRFRPEIVLCDVGLPGLDGYAVARILRQQPETSGLSLIAVSGYTQEAVQRRALEAGFNGYLIKPIDFSELEKLLATSIGKLSLTRR